MNFQSKFPRYQIIGFILLTLVVSLLVSHATINITQGQAPLTIAATATANVELVAQLRVQLISLLRQLLAILQAQLTELTGQRVTRGGGGSGGGSSGSNNNSDNTNGGDNNEPPIIIPDTGTNSPMSTASVTTCIAPCPIYFDATTASSGVLQPTDGIYGLMYHTWDFGDPASGNWTTGNKKPDGNYPSRNEATGFVSAHVYEIPGTYTVTLAVKPTESATPVTYTQQITVNAFSGRTICVSQTSDWADCPSTNSGDRFTTLATGLTALNQQSGGRLLLRRGEEFIPEPNKGLSIGAGKQLGSYGTGTLPKINFINGDISKYPPGLSLGIGAVAQDVYLTGDNTLTNGLSNAGNNLLLRVKFDGGGCRITGCSFGSSLADHLGEYTYLVDSEFIGTDASHAGLLATQKDHLVILGSILSQPVRTVSNGGHVLYDQNADHHLFAYSNFISGIANRYEALRITPNTRTTGFSLVVGNYFDGHVEASWTATGTYNPTNPLHLENILIEGNYIRAFPNSTDQPALWIAETNKKLVVRNNILVGNTYPSTLIHKNHQAEVPSGVVGPFDVFIYNNVITNPVPVYKIEGDTIPSRIYLFNNTINNTCQARTYTSEGTTYPAWIPATCGGAVQPPTNIAPIVNAGADQAITLPINQVTLTGTATDDSLPNPPAAMTYAWSKVSGAGTVTFSNSSALATTATFSSADTYVLRLTASDGTLSSTNDVTIVVSSAPVVLPTAINWPLRISASGKYLEDQNSKPFLIAGDAAWEIESQISREAVITYLDDRKAKGFNAIELKAIDILFQDNSPNNYYNEPPFTNGPSDWSVRNPAYWEHLDYILDEIKEREMVAIIFPAYLGNNCGSEGWCPQMIAQTDAVMNNYGQWIGNRYKDYGNIIWMTGGDADATGTAASRNAAIVSGIRAVDTDAIFSAEPAINKIAGIDSYISLVDINGVYTHGSPQSKTQIAYANARPFIFQEGYYENDLWNNKLPVDQDSQAMITYLGGGAGHIFGTCPLWNFGSTKGAGWCASHAPPFDTWQHNLNSPNSISQGNIAKLMHSRKWWTLVPDYSNTVVTSAKGNEINYHATAREATGETVMVWAPDTNQITVDMTKISGAQAHGWWFNVADGSATDLGTFNTIGTRNFTPPAGRRVLVLDDASRNLAAPGTTVYGNVIVFSSPSRSFLASIYQAVTNLFR